MSRVVDIGQLLNDLAEQTREGFAGDRSGLEDETRSGPAAGFGQPCRAAIPVHGRSADECLQARLSRSRSKPARSGQPEAGGGRHAAPGGRRRRRRLCA